MANTLEDLIDTTSRRHIPKLQPDPGRGLILSQVLSLLIHSSQNSADRQNPTQTPLKGQRESEVYDHNSS